MRRENLQDLEAIRDHEVMVVGRASPLQDAFAIIQIGAHGVTFPTFRSMESHLSGFRTLCAHEPERGIYSASVSACPRASE